MRKSLILVIAALALLGSGCNEPVAPPTVKNDDSVNQVFEQKKQCEPYYAAYKDEKNNTLRSPYGTVKVSGCFSKKYNSCIGVSEVSDSKADDTAWTEWEVKDLLTGEVVSFVKDQTFGKGRENDDAWYVERQHKLSKDVMGIDCSDGQQLYPVR